MPEPVHRRWIRRCTMPSIALYVFLALTFAKAPAPPSRGDADPEVRCVLCLGAKDAEKNLPEATPPCAV